MFLKVFLLMVLCHIIDDFVFQPVCLSNLKQKNYWERLCKDANVDIEKYKNDYIAALIIHAFSWSIMIMLTVMFLVPTISCIALIGCIIINGLVHAYVDDLKANKFELNLVEDQLIHFIQIFITFIIIILSIIL